MPLYDALGATYSTTRREDPRIAAQIWDAVGAGRSLVNVGAGTGNYEPSDRLVVAIEPSDTMMRQRRGRTRNVVQGGAEELPFPDRSFDAALAVLTVHHWSDRDAGLAEMKRVARRQVIFYFEPLANHGFWGMEYFPASRNLPTERNPPGEAHFRACLDVREIQPILVPSDCVDGFGAAFWCRPEAYLDPEVQAGMSWIALLPTEVKARATEQLRNDLESGEWDRRFGHLRSMDQYDGGYRLAIAGPPG